MFRSTARADSTALNAVEEADTPDRRGLASDAAQAHQNDDTPHSPRPRGSRAVKITAWRIINTGFLLGLGVPKAVATYNAPATVVNGLDWALGVVWALISYWIGFVEQDSPESAPWLFERDLRLVLGNGIAGLCGIIWLAFCVAVSFAAGQIVASLLFEDDIARGRNDRLIALGLLCGFVFLGLLASVTVGGYMLFQRFWRDFKMPFTLPPLSSSFLHASDWSFRNINDSNATRLTFWAGAVLWWALWWWVVSIRSASEGIFFHTATAASITASVICSYITLGVIRTVSRWMELPWPTSS
ncbi:hypothetical protein B0H13DRAFT_2006511 [Mycena leptocephala]|nr:hypothetical protein B0H13DRAFT_2006511 [Mycena leptocephala]